MGVLGRVHRQTASPAHSLSAGVGMQVDFKTPDTSGGFRLSPTAPGVLPAVSIHLPNPFKR